jgi:hypothetical protein
MPSETNTPSPTLLQFPCSPDRKYPSEVDRAIVLAHSHDIHECITETRQALQELRHGVLYCLLDLLDKLQLDRWTLTVLLDERPSVILDLLQGETDELTTERLIDILDLLRTP